MGYLSPLVPQGVGYSSPVGTSGCGLFLSRCYSRVWLFLSRCYSRVWINLFLMSDKPATERGFAQGTLSRFTVRHAFVRRGILNIVGYTGARMPPE